MTTQGRLAGEHGAQDGGPRRPDEQASAMIAAMPIAYVALDGDDRVVDWNGSAQALLGWPRGDAIGRDVAELLAPADGAAALRVRLAALRADARERGRPCHELLRLARQAGPALRAALTLAPLPDGTTALWLRPSADDPLDDGAGPDAFDRDRLGDVADNVPILIAYIDAQERLQYGNATFLRWIRIDPVMARGRPFREVVGEDRYADNGAHVRRALAGERVTFEIDASGLIGRHLRNELIPDFRPDGSVAGVYSLTTDVTSMKQAERRLEQLSRVDALTGLPNRRAGEERLAEAMARTRRSGRPMALMFLDVDHFKTINDTHGHRTGDEVLRHFAQRLRASVRAADAVVRLGGDEFVIVLEGLADEHEPGRVAAKILAQAQVPVQVGPLALRLSTSIGSVVYRGGPGSAAALLEEADGALYRAKSAGRGRACAA